MLSSIIETRFIIRCETATVRYLVTCDPSALKWSRADFLNSPFTEPSKRYRENYKSIKY